MANGSTAVCHFLFDRKANKPDTAKKAIENKIEKAIWIHMYTKGLLGYSQLYIPPICRLNMVIGLLAGNKIYATIVLCILLITMYLYISKRDFLYETVEKNL